ncbi:MAG TPA: hypothetical protein VHO90_12005 [Bacteroidales bacterium]|nr:hypothetical protein [Bacteroidales bacterium]
MTTSVTGRTNVTGNAIRKTSAASAGLGSLASLTSLEAAVTGLIAGGND